MLWLIVPLLYLTKELMEALTMILDRMNRRLIEIFNIDVRKEVLEVDGGS